MVALFLYSNAQPVGAEALSFRNWHANCDVESGRCSLLSRSDDGAGVRIDRSGLADPLSLSFSAAGSVRPVELTLGVDRHTAISLRSGEGLSADGAWLKLVDQRAKYRLLNDMRHGRRLQLTWRTAAGEPGRVALPLAGLEQALRFAENFQAEYPLEGARVAANRDVLVCGGGEPSWRLAIDHETASFKPPGAGPERALEGVLQPVASAVPPILVWRGADGERDLVAMLSETVCRTDNGVTMAFNAVVSAPSGAIWTGCCQLERSMEDVAGEDQLDAEVGAVAPAEPDWSEALIALWPAIGACLDWTPGVPIVLKAWSMDGDRVGVRTRNRDNDKLMDCIAPADGSSIELLDALAEGAAPLPGQSQPEFVPRSAGEPTACAGVRPVSDEAGSSLGWLVDPEQC